MFPRSIAARSPFQSSPRSKPPLGTGLEIRSDCIQHICQHSGGKKVAYSLSFKGELQSLIFKSIFGDDVKFHIYSIFIICPVVIPRSRAHFHFMCVDYHHCSNSWECFFIQTSCNVSIIFKSLIMGKCLSNKSQARPCGIVTDTFHDLVSYHTHDWLLIIIQWHTIAVSLSAAVL